MGTVLIRSLVAGTIAASTMLLTTATAAASPDRERDPVEASAPAAATDVGALVTKLSHAQATDRLRAAGITWSSTGNCSDRDNPMCTSFEQVNLESIQGAETFKRASSCGLNITGGTETGHQAGPYSHWNGYKLDFSLSACVSNYITRNFTSIGGNKWRSGSGNIYFRESNHWDVTYFNCGGC